jgi:protein gp37
MSQHSTIEWTNATWNPIVGCSIKSPGCSSCYAMKDAWRKHHNPKLPHYHGLTKKVNGHPVWTGILRQSPEHILTAPLHWREPRMVFVNSMSDLFHEDVPDEWIDPVFDVMARCPHHTFQVLTKRSDRMRTWAAKAMVRHHVCGGDGCNYCGDAGGIVRWKGCPLPNVWLGVSAERQKEADERIPDLLATPAAVRFVSLEPLIGPIDLDAVPVSVAPGFFGGALRWHHRGKCHQDERVAYPTLDWVIVGGESGNGATPMHPAWARSIRDQCAAAGKIDRLFFKQWGAWAPGMPVASGEKGRFALWSESGSGWTYYDESPRHFARFGADARMTFVGKKAAGRLLDGVEHNGMPNAATR